MTTAPLIADLVSQLSVSTGTGVFSLTPVQGRQPFSIFGTGGTDKFFYFITNGSANEWEVGTGHLSDASTLVRDTVLGSSNAGALVNFSSGTKTVVNDVPASYQNQLLNPALRTITAAGPITLLVSDKIVQINQSVGATMTVNIDPAALIVGKYYTVKDRKGDAATNNITLVPSSGSFDGAGTYVMSYPYQAITFYSDGTNLCGVA